MSAHTPGPWNFWEGPEYMGGGQDLCIGAGETWLFNMDHRNSKCEKEWHEGYQKHLEGGDCDICSTGGEEITEEQRANARLIASAPLLLEVCEELVAITPDGALKLEELDLLVRQLDVVCEKARKALTAAKELE